MKIGVLALQGAFIEHINMLKALGAAPVEIRQKADLAPDFSGLVLPGGESTVMSLLLHKLGLFEPLRTAIIGGLPTFGTCAGLILLAQHFNVLDVAVNRHGFGRQINSFSEYGDFAGLGQTPMVFIRGPYITEVGDDVKILARAKDKIVAVQQNNILGVAFHPELTDDSKVHEYFLKKTIDK
ncbi:MAG: pyridoxal 5'-phosphate synthase glutaminase subunit PdxT [Defluviitaleaceae bacterium]|nr:pyridoxal 5'-phosphate synthase glutaminase subunit PdxT [Defluviitaleaceae bacterium]